VDVSELEMLIDGINTELPFPPPFQYKKFGHAPFPQIFDKDVTYLGDWSALCLYPLEDIEWIFVRPRYLKRIGKLVPKQVISCENEFLKLLTKLGVSFKNESGNVYIYAKSS